MVGSKKWFRYTTDEGDDFALLADESNTELAGGAVDLTGGASTLYGLPGNIRPRYGRYRSADGLVVRKCYSCTLGATLTTPIIDPSSGLSLELSAIVAEERTFATGTDTGLLDGDAS
jgi:hypothetical protein